MASTFAITVLPDTPVVLDKDRRGTTTFTVTNTSGRALRGRARLTPVAVTARAVPAPGTPASPGAPSMSPSQPASVAWLTIKDGEERALPVKGADTYTIEISVPMDVAPGSYAFRLDENAVDDMDETLTEGPTSSIKVPPAPVKIEPKPFPWWIVLVALAVVVIVGVGIYLLINRQSGPVVTPTPSPVAVSPVAASTVAPSIRAQGTLLISPNTGASLRSTTAPKPTEADIFFEVRSGPPTTTPILRSLEAVGKARLAPLPGSSGATPQPGPNACTGPLTTAAVSSVALGDLPPNSYLCVLTIDGRVSVAHVISNFTVVPTSTTGPTPLPAATSLNLQFLTWDVDGPIPTEPLVQVHSVLMLADGGFVNLRDPNNTSAFAADLSFTGRMLAGLSGAVLARPPVVFPAPFPTPPIIGRAECGATFGLPAATGAPPPLTPGTILCVRTGGADSRTGRVLILSAQSGSLAIDFITWKP